MILRFGSARPGRALFFKKFSIALYTFSGNRPIIQIEAAGESGRPLLAAEKIFKKL